MIRYLGFAISALLIIPASAGAQSTGPLREVLEFEELQPKCVASSTRGVFGSGPIRIKGTSHRFGADTNVAVVVDTAHPDADPDLATAGYHNALIISRIRPQRPAAEEAAWATGFVESVDDDAVPGGVLSFDFSEIGPVTFHALTLLDHDDHAASVRIFQTADAAPLLGEAVPDGTRLDLNWGPKSFLRWLRGERRRARLTLRSEERAFHRLQVAPRPQSSRASEITIANLRAHGQEARSVVGRGPFLAAGIPDVTRIEVELGGSSAVDRLVFTRQGSGMPEVEDDIFSRIQRYLSGRVEPQLELVRLKYLEGWNALADNPASTVRADLDRLLTELEHDLIGTVTEDGTHAGGLLQCPELRCGCPELRALRAWVEVQIASMRTDLANATDAQLMTIAPAPSEAQIAALEPAVYLAQAPGGSRIMLAQQAGGSGCAEGTFGERFFCRGLEIVTGAAEVVASVFSPSIELEPDTVTVAGDAKPCQAYRLTPMSPEFDHIETGILPGQPRRVPRGLYCVLCRTADDRLHPKGKLDLVKDPNAKPQLLVGAECGAGG